MPAAAAGLLALLRVAGHAQLTGPSDPAGLATVIDIPADRPAIGDDGSVGDGTQLNLFDGGSIGHRFDAGSFRPPTTNIEVNLRRHGRR